MRITATVLVPTMAWALLAAPTPAQETPAGSNADAMDAARQLHERYAAAYNDQDSEALAARFAPDADWIVMAGDQVTRRLQGRDEIRRYYEELFRDSPEIRVRLDSEHARFVAPGVLVVDGTWSVTGLTSEAPPEGRYTAIYRQQDDRWEVAGLRLMTATSGGAPG